jgi:hypothetical protein
MTGFAKIFHSIGSIFGRALKRPIAYPRAAANAVDGTGGQIARKAFFVSRRKKHPVAVERPIAVGFDPNLTGISLLNL